jgi:F420-dependent oxidoreductase-like protein
MHPQSHIPDCRQPFPGWSRKEIFMRLRVLMEPRRGATYQQILALARTTEEAGFDGFFRGDHYLGIDAGDPSYLPSDSWTTLAGLALQTSRVRLGTLMTASTYRLPGPLAITVATVHAMSGGRVEFGIGAAWYEREHRSFGIPFPPTGERFDRLEEQLAVITGLWSTPPGERFSFAGKHYQIDECANFPDTGPNSSTPSSGVPPRIIIGGVGPRRTPALAARFADEFNCGLGSDDSGRFANFRRICAEQGRDPSTVRLSTTLPVCCGLTRGEASRRAESLGEPGARLLRLGVVGTPADVLGRLEQFAAIGVDTVYLHLYDVLDLDHVRLLGEEVAAHA